MLKNLKKEEFYCGLSNEKLEELANKFPSLIFEDRDDLVGKTKEYILEVYKDFQGGVFQEKNGFYVYLDLPIGTSHLFCILFIDVCVKACLIKDEKVTSCSAILLQLLQKKMSKQQIIC